MKDSFSRLNPFVNLIFFAFVIVLTMFTLNPICIGISLVCALLNALYLNGKKAVRISLLYLLPMAVMISLINPLFNHQGVTILTYFSWGNPLTLESIIYGIATAVLLSSTVLWFSCFNTVMTSDKFVYLFGKAAPSLSLVLSMTLRFVPKFTAQMKKVRQSQKCIGRDVSDGGLISRIKHGIKIISIMITWSLENAIETADSMKSRGHGLKGRTAYSVFKFTQRDFAVLAFELVLGLAAVILLFGGISGFWYYPSISGNIFEAISVFDYLIYAALMLMPLVINVWEGEKWKRLRSKI